jgi:hypothetical protein
LRPRRGRNLFDRLRQAGRPSDVSEQAPVRSRHEAQPRVYDALDDVFGADELLTAAAEELTVAGPAPVFADGEPTVPGEQSGAAGGSEDILGGSPAQPGGREQRAIEAFNAGEHPRRIAGVARSLGIPSVSVLPDKDFGSLVSIVIAWELCWYRYGVDVDDREGGARVLAQGTELSELAREERLANAVADELGTLSLTAA